MGHTPAKPSKFTGKVLEVYQRDGREYTRFEVAGPIYPADPPPAAKFEDGSKLDVTITVECCSDGTIYDVQQTAKIQGEVITSDEAGWRRRNQVSGTIFRSLTEAGAGEAKK